MALKDNENEIVKLCVKLRIPNMTKRQRSLLETKRTKARESRKDLIRKKREVETEYRQLSKDLKELKKERNRIKAHHPNSSLVSSSDESE